MNENEQKKMSDHFLEREKKLIEEFRKEEQLNMTDEASHLINNFEDNYYKLLKRQNKTNVLIVGITGAGKSSLINSIFGREYAQTGTGKPITQHFIKHSADEFPVNIYDSKGLEHGNGRSFIKTTKDFLKEHGVGKNGESENAIHVVWYVINSAFGRWEPFEEIICKEVFDKIPIIFILNKADLTTDIERSNIKKCIESMNLKNFKGIFDVISLENRLKFFTNCKTCWSEDIIIRKKNSEGICMDCNAKESLKLDNGRTELVKATYDILPSFVKNAFTMAQKVSFYIKKKHSIVIIKTFWNKWKHLYSTRKFIKIITSMLITLSLNWNLKHSKEYAKFVSKDLVKVFTLSDKFKLLFHKNTFNQQIHSTSLGILWNRCLVNLNKDLLSEWKKFNIQERDINFCRNKVNDILKNFNATSLLSIENKLRTDGIETFLNRELSTEIC